MNTITIPASISQRLANSHATARDRALLARNYKQARFHAWARELWQRMADVEYRHHSAAAHGPKV